jgi:hypothetical protein
MPGGGPCTTDGSMVTSDQWLCCLHISKAFCSASTLDLHTRAPQMSLIGVYNGTKPHHRLLLPTKGPQPCMQRGQHGICDTCTMHGLAYGYAPVFRPRFGDTAVCCMTRACLWYGKNVCVAVWFQSVSV